MSTVRGLDGLVALGGYVPDAIYVQGAVAQSATAATFDGNGGTARGVIRPGDTFTVAGDGQTYTIVTGGVFGDPTADERAVTFTPGVVPGGGWADNAVVTMNLNQLVQVRAFELNVERILHDATVFRSAARVWKSGFSEFQGSITALFDAADADQTTFINNVLSAAGPEFALTLTAEDGTQFWGDVVASAFTHQQQFDQLVELQLSFAGRGALGTDF